MKTKTKTVAMTSVGAFVVVAVVVVSIRGALARPGTLTETEKIDEEESKRTPP